MTQTKFKNGTGSMVDNDPHFSSDDWKDAKFLLVNSSKDSVSFLNSNTRTIQKIIIYNEINIWKDTNKYIPGQIK